MTTFTKEPSDEILERICDAAWNQGIGTGVTPGIRFLDTHQINACNHVYSGTIEVDGVVHGFIIESGDIAGTEIKAWGDPEEVGVYQAPEFVPVTFIPEDDDLFFKRKVMFDVYLRWRQAEWFTELQAKYNYDRHFQPGSFIEDNYKKQITPKGLKFGYFKNLPKEALDYAEKFYNMKS